MGMRVPSAFHAPFAVWTEPRCPCAPKSRHLLMDILVMAVCAVLSGAEGGEDIAEDGEATAEWLKARLALPQGLPGPAPCRRVVSPLAPAALPQGCIAWPQARSEAAGGDRVSIDGQTRRHSCAQAPATAAIHMGRAGASANRVGWGPRPVEEPSNAMPAMPQLLPLLDRKGAGGTMEARGCQQESAKTIPEQGAEDGLALKDHPPTLSEAVTLLLHEARDTGGADMAPASHDTVDGDHGRMATRRYWLTAAMAWLGAKGSGANVPSVGMVEARRAVGDTVQVEPRDGLTSLPAPAMRFAQAVRPHWGSEHALPWGREVSFAEAACRMRKDQGAQTVAVLRHRALHLLRREPPHTRGITARRKRAGWDRASLFQVLTG
jgi:predicted transposase YbfD/YdcC